MMKRTLLALALVLVPALALAQAALVDLAKENTTTTGTGTLTVTGAVTGYLTIEAAATQLGVTVDGQSVSYGIVDGNNRESGRGVYTASNNTLTRCASDCASTNGGSPISLSGSATVGITAIHQDFADRQPLDSDLTSWAAVTRAAGFDTFVATPSSANLASFVTDDQFLLSDTDLGSWAAVTRAAGFDTFVATPSSANLASFVTDETGSGALVFGTAPDLTISATTEANIEAAFDAFGASVDMSGFDLTASSVNSVINLNVNSNASYQALTIDNDSTGGSSDVQVTLAAGTTASSHFWCGISGGGCEWSATAGYIGIEGNTNVFIKSDRGGTPKTWTLLQTTGAWQPGTNASFDIGVDDTNEIRDLFMNGTQLSLDDNTALRFRETEANGDNYLAFVAPAAITSDATCTLENDSSPIPDSCVGNGTDDTGGGGVSDGDKGDITVSGTGTVWDVILTGTDRARFDDATGIIDENSNEQLIFQTTASAVNQFDITNSATGGVQRLEATGDDAAIAVTIASKSTDPINFEVDAATEWSIDAAALVPGADAANDIGTSTVGINDLHLGLAGVVNFDGGDVTLTHAANSLTFAGGDLFLPTLNDSVVMGHTAQLGYDNSHTPTFQMHGTNGNTAAIAASEWSATDTDESHLILSKSGSGTIGTFTSVAADEALGKISFQAADGSSPFEESAKIEAEIDAAVSNGDVPGRLVFSTTLDGANAPTKRMTIKNDGGLVVGDGTNSPSRGALALADSAPGSGAGGELRWAEDTDNGNNFFAIRAPATFTSDSTCVLENDANPIPDSCVGDGTDGGGGGLSDGDYGDVTVSGTGTVIDIDPTITVGTGSTVTWTFDAGATDPVLTFGSGTIDMGTGTVVTHGNLELGAASDTTLARSAAGEATLEGDAIKHAGRQTIPLQAAAGTYPVGGAISPCVAQPANDSGSQDVFFRTCQFSASTDNAIYYTFFFPKSASESTDLALQIDWQSGTTTDTTDDVIWTASAVCFSNDDPINGNAFPAVDTVTDTQTAANDYLVTGEITAITPAGTPTEGDGCVLRITRDADNASDNFNGTADLIQARLYYTDNASSDD